MRVFGVYISVASREIERHPNPDTLGNICTHILQNIGFLHLSVERSENLLGPTSLSFDGRQVYPHPDRIHSNHHCLGAHENGHDTKLEEEPGKIMLRVEICALVTAQKNKHSKNQYLEQTTTPHV